MKKFLALLFVCAGLTAMAVNPVHTGRMPAQKMTKSTMLSKDNKMSKELTKNVMSMPKMKVGQPGSLHEFAMTHDLTQNKLMKRAPKRATYTDIEGDWLYTSIENVDGTPSWYSMSSLNIAIDTIFEDNGYCEVALGVMPFVTDMSAVGYDAGYYTNFPKAWAWYEPATDSIGVFGAWSNVYFWSGSRSGSNTYTMTVQDLYIGIGTPDGMPTVVADGVADLENGVITLNGEFGAATALVSRSYKISKSNWNTIASYLVQQGVVGGTSAQYYEDIIFYIVNYFNDYVTSETLIDSTFYAPTTTYTNHVFLLPNATHTYDQAYKASTLDTTFVDEDHEVYVMDSVVNKSVAVFAYQNETNDSIFTYNLWNLANYPDVAFTIDANAAVMFPWQPVYREDMTEFTEYYHNQGYPYNFTNAFCNFNSTYAPYDQDGVVGYYNTAIDWEDTPCEINADLNEITWNGTEIMDLLYTDDDVDEEGNIAGYYMGVGFTSAWVNNKLTFNYALTLPEPAETWQLGDVNHDGFVDVGDVTALISHILGNTPDVFYFEEANVDQDAEGAYDVGDVTALIAIILGN